jgi:hypothetical protein
MAALWPFPIAVARTIRRHWSQVAAKSLMQKELARPERFELPTKYLFYIDKYFINPLHIACTGM